MNYPNYTEEDLQLFSKRFDEEFDDFLSHKKHWIETARKKPQHSFEASMVLSTPFDTVKEKLERIKTSERERKAEVEAAKKENRKLDCFIEFGDLGTAESIVTYKWRLEIGK